MREADIPIKLLFEVSPLNVGGPQAWVCDMATALKRRGVQIQVLSIEFLAAQDSILENRLRQGGIPTQRTFLAGNVLNKICLVYSAISRFRKCDVIHVNSDALSGLFLFCAKHCGIKIRIAHSRTPSWTRQKQGLKNWCCHKLFHWLARRYCTHAFGVTQPALESLLGHNGGRAIPCGVVPSAICIQRYGPRSTRTRMEAQKRMVVGFVGRITASKNPIFLVEVLSRIRSRGVNAELLFVGAGPDEEGVWAAARALEITKHVVIMPPQEDIASILSNQIDVLVLPSEYEGTPRVVVEAQASGVPVVCSSGVPKDVSIVPELFQSLHLTESADAWADSILRANECCVPQTRIGECFASSGFDIENQADMLLGLYRKYASL